MCNVPSTHMYIFGIFYHKTTSEQKTDVCPFFVERQNPGMKFHTDRYMFFFQSKVEVEFIYILIPTKLGIKFQKL